jgi:hypothetical protein
LRYFNEKSGKACGRCDVCLNHSEHSLGAGEFEQISKRLQSRLQEGSLALSEAMAACPVADEEEVMEAVRWMVDNGILLLEGDHLSLKKA